MGEEKLSLNQKRKDRQRSIFVKYVNRNILGSRRLSKEMQCCDECDQDININNGSVYLGAKNAAELVFCSVGCLITKCLIKPAKSSGG